MTLPTAVIADKEFLFTPALPEKTEARARAAARARRQAVSCARQTPKSSSRTAALFGNIDRSATATYHLRPFGRPLIEAYFGGSCARELEAGGEGAFFDFAVRELARLLGSDFDAPRQAARHSSLGRRSVRARLLFICAAGQGRTAARRSPRRSTIVCSLPARPARPDRFLDRAWRLSRTGVAAAEQAIAAPRQRKRVTFSYPTFNSDTSARSAAMIEGATSSCRCADFPTARSRSSW